MAEKVYKTMKSVGAFSLVTGILLIVGGIAAGRASADGKGKGDTRRPGVRAVCAAG